jgi:hypothetical protein
VEFDARDWPDVRRRDLWVPVGQGPEGPAGKEGIAVRSTRDVSGLLEVQVCVDSTGKMSRMVIEGASSLRFALQQCTRNNPKFHPYRRSLRATS